MSESHQVHRWAELSNVPKEQAIRRESTIVPFFDPEIKMT